MCLIKPDGLSRSRVCSDGLARLPGPELTSGPPLIVDVTCSAEFLNFGGVGGSKHLLKRKIQPRSIVPYVHHPVFGEPCLYIGTEALKYLDAAGNRSFPSNRCGFQTTEPDFHQPSPS